ncbi:MAG: hypothetical protein ACYDA2_10775, partial [Acidimicrobiales bacterium]
MGTLGDILLALAGVVAVLTLPLEAAVAVLVGFWLLVPGLLSVPHLPHVFLVNRTVLWAFGLGLLFRSPKPARSSPFRLTPMHGAFGMTLVVWWFVGVVYTPVGFNVRANIDEWLLFLDMAIVFVAVLAAARMIGTRRLVRIVVAVVGVSLVIGLVESQTGHSWGNFFFEHLPSRYIAPGASPITTRGGAPRPSGSAQFPLEYGWVLVFLFGLVIVTSLRWARARWRRWGNLPFVVVGLPVLAAAVILLAKGRSSDVAVPVVVLLLLVLGGGNRQVVTAAVAAAVLGYSIWALDPQLFSSAFHHTESTATRLNRLPVVFSQLVDHPWTGLSFVGNQTFAGLDNGYAYTYAQLGILGLLSWVVLLASAAVTALSTLRAPRNSEERLLGAACFIGIIGIATACAIYDLTSTPQSRWTFAVLAALATHLKESLPAPAGVVVK